MNDGYTHAENLHIFIKEVLHQSKISANQLDAVAVGLGPGSYTGLRIGMSAAKGFCYALNKPLIGISTHQSMAADVKNRTGINENETLIALTDARRMEVYFSVMDVQLKEIEKSSCKIITADSVKEWGKHKKIFFFGSGLGKSKSFLEKIPGHFFIDGILPTAKNMERLSHARFCKKEFENIAYAEPLYMKEFYTTAPAQKE